MRALVTGATGKLGRSVVARLLARGVEVRALVRDPESAAGCLPPGVELVRGDVTDPASLGAAPEDCELVFNAMGIPEQWVRDETVFDRVNAEGTAAVVRAAAAAGVRRVVHISTVDVFEGEPGARFDESRVATAPKGTAYQRSKQRAEQLALAVPGVELVIVNPSGLYGPGPSSSMAIERRLFDPIVERRRLALPALPPGGLNVVHTPDVGEGAVLAGELGVPGQRYILSERYVPLRELAEALVAAAGRGRVPASMPLPFARVVAAGGAIAAKVVRQPPPLPRGQLHLFLWGAKADAAKAKRELGWSPTPLGRGLAATLAPEVPAPAPVPVPVAVR
jgi:dihydroflavonol-4-reductase